MAWNPSPKVAVARDFAKKFDKQQVVILSVTKDGILEYASYGKTKRLCNKAKKLADIAFEAVLNNW